MLAALFSRLCNEEPRFDLCHTILFKAAEDHIEPAWDALDRSQYGEVAGHIFAFREEVDLYQRCRAGERVRCWHVAGSRSWDPV